MTDPQDPPRLIDSDTGSDRLRELVRQSREDTASADDVKRMEARLVPLIWPPTPPAAPGTGSTGSGAGATAATTSGGLVKAGVVAVAIGLAGGGLWISKSASRAPAGPAATPAAHEVNQAAEPAAPGHEVPASPSDDVGAGTDAPSATTGTPSHKINGTNDKNAPVLDSASESDLLGRAQSALRSDPARALALSDEHRRLYPKGTLVQEREVLAIEALERMGRHKEALARADRFIRTFPGSAHRSKVNEVVGRE